MKHKFLFLAVLLSTLFTTGLWAQTPGYALYGDVPYGYEDLTSKIVLPTSATVDAGIMSLTGIGLPGRLCENNYLSFSLNEAVSMTLTSNYAIHVVLKRAASANNVQIVLCKNGWNAARAAFELPAASISADDYADVTVAYGDRRTDNWNSYGDAGMIDVGGVSFPAAEVLRMAAANSEVVYISQIYIDADATSPDPVAPVAGDEDAPTGLTLAASNIQDKSVTLTATATDENSPISYTFYYKAADDADFTAVSGAVNAASGADAVKVVSCLTPETTYSFKVVASDPSSNSSDYSISGITTLALVERRYYFFRGDPASVTLPSVGVISYDLRRGVKTNVAPQGGMTLTENKYFSHFARSGSWWSFNQSLSASFDMSEISQADWYLVVKFRTDYTSNSFNIRLNNGISYQVSQNNLSISTDGTWNVLTLALADAKNTLTYSAFSANQMLLQFHADNDAGSYLDIAYAYLTNNAASVDDLVDNVAPVISSLSDGDKTTNSVVLTVTASDDSGEDLTYIVKEGEEELTSTPATGVSGAVTAITVSELVGQDHTLTVIARDGAGNEVSQNIVVTLPAAVAPPSNLVVTTSNTDKSVTFTMSADDANPSLVYAILDGSDNDNVLEDNIAGTAGVETVYTLHGLIPETAYSFKVRVTNAASLSTTSDAIDVTTDALSEHRFYLTRGDNSDPLPASSNLTSTYVDCDVNVAGNGAKDTRVSKYLSIRSKADSYMAITFNPKATVANEIDDNWYIVVRFRANLSNNVFGFNNFRLNLSNNAQNWYINNDDADKPFGRDYYDGQWIVLKKRIGDRRVGSAVPASYLQTGQVAAQLHVNANLIAGEFLDVDYVYFTDDITSIDEGTQYNAKIMLKDNADNSDVLAAHDGQTLDVDLTRSLVNASYNTLCLPFSMSAAQIEEHFGAEAKIARLSGAAIEGDELILGFAFVNDIQAGVPYIIQPEANVSNPLIHNVTIANTEAPAVFGDVRFIGVFNPTEIEQQSAAEHSILLLGANNQLSWPNTTANLKGTRAYFWTSSTVARVVRRARMGFDAAEVATGLDEISNTRSQTTRKVLINNQLYIIRDGEVYNVTGVRVK